MHAKGDAPLVVGMGRVGVAISSLSPNVPIVDAGAAELAAMSTIPAPGVAVALRAALRLGCRARLAGSHGADLLGGLARSALQDAGIDVEHLRARGHPRATSSWWRQTARSGCITPVTGGMPPPPWSTWRARSRGPRPR
ncbi:MAG: hypothetical protein NT062_26895 [Proteobacteria bacterium]|nr:hypothetical protein [Pseudomonadota bacterium]